MRNDRTFKGTNLGRRKNFGLEAPEVVVALLGHGGMISKFCNLEASPQNNEAWICICYVVVVLQYLGLYMVVLGVVLDLQSRHIL